jgi:hypothetical protein
VTRRELTAAIARAYRSGATVPRISVRFHVRPRFVREALRERGVPLRVTGECEHPSRRVGVPCPACRVARDNALRAAKESARSASPRGAAQRAEALAATPVVCCWCSRGMTRGEARGIGRGWQCREGEGCAVARTARAA